MESTTTYIEEARNDISTVKTEEELSCKISEWVKKIGRDAVVFYPDILTNEEGQKWLFIVTENIKALLEEQWEKVV